MDSGRQHYPSAIARIIVARRAQLRARLLFAAVVTVTFQVYTGIVAALLWAAVYTFLQLLEFHAFRGLRNEGVVSGVTQVGFHLIILGICSVFTVFGLVIAYQGSTWGILCAAILWTGAIANATIINGESRGALVCTILPPMLAFLTLPNLIMANGGSAIDGVAVVAAGMINALGSITMWSVYQRLLKSVTEARAASRLALTDSETGLPNRAAMERTLAELVQSGSPGVVVAVVINLDRFQHLRGAIGHTATIELMRRLAARFTRAYDGASIVRLSSANLGLAFIARDSNHAQYIAAQLQGAVTTPLLLRDNRVDVSITIGLSQPSDAITSTADLSIIDRAMIAVDQARAARKQIAFFDAAQYGDPGISLSLMSEMLRAFDNGQMDVAYQPQYGLRSGEIVGAEALIRWTHPERGALRPDLFVQMAEETGHIAALTEWVLRRAVADQRQLQDAGFDTCISVNWSGHLLDDGAFTDKALEIIGHAPGKLCLEVTETAIIGNARVARQTLERFRAAGLSISIDDYGSGLSSLAYLKNIPADELKIDKSFVMQVATDEVDAVLVRSAVGLAHSLGLRVVAEGVEDQRALDLLSTMGCDIAQGYLIARPMPFADLVAFLGAHAIEDDAPASAAAVVSPLG